MDTWNRLTDLRGVGVGGTGRNQPKNIYACMCSAWTHGQTQQYSEGRAGGRQGLGGEGKRGEAGTSVIVSTIKVF